jgi:hypothetical protein
MRISRQLAIVILSAAARHCRGRGLSDQADPVDRTVSAESTGKRIDVASILYLTPGVEA